MYEFLVIFCLAFLSYCSYLSVIIPYREKKRLDRLKTDKFFDSLANK